MFHLDAMLLQTSASVANSKGLHHYAMSKLREAAMVHSDPSSIVSLLESSIVSEMMYLQASDLERAAKLLTEES